MTTTIVVKTADRAASISQGRDWQVNEPTQQAYGHESRTSVLPPHSEKEFTLSDGHFGVSELPEGVTTLECATTTGSNAPEDAALADEADDGEPDKPVIDDDWNNLFQKEAAKPQGTANPDYEA